MIALVGAALSVRVCGLCARDLPVRGLSVRRLWLCVRGRWPCVRGLSVRRLWLCVRGLFTQRRSHRRRCVQTGSGFEALVRALFGSWALRGAFLLVACHGCAAGGGRTLPTDVQRGDPFDFRLPQLDGTQVRASSFRGKVVLVDVWATWCAPCEKSFPFYADLVEQLGSESFEIIAVSVDERAEDVATWLEGRNLPFVIVHDPEGTVPGRIGLRTMPSAVLLDREGRVTDIHAGFDPADEPEIEQMIRDALGAPAGS